MSQDATLLIEIGTEELPPEHLEHLSQAFCDGIRQAFDAQQIPYQQIEDFASPRRIAARFHHVPKTQPVRQIKRRGPTLQAAYDENGEPTKALKGFMKSCGATKDTLQVEETAQGAWVTYSYEEPGKSLTQVLPGIIENAIAAIPAKKKMRWGSGSLEFLRPIHWICIVHGSEPIAVNIFQYTSSGQSFGHPVHHKEPVTITHADDYLKLLRQAYVIADYRLRRAMIQTGAEELAAKNRAHAVISENLLDQVTGLVEWPVILLASFDPDFLAIPQEALMSSMQNHQKCFPLQTDTKTLLPHFIVVSNVQAPDSQNIIRGNERVMKARLEDAKFFFEQDKKIPLSSRVDSLKNMVFQKSLGTLYDKSHRMAKLASLIAKQIGCHAHFAEHAAKLCKADLLTEMVYEFPELQGIMGYYYATFDGEPPEVAEAIKESYLPRFAKDDVPQTPTGICVALADRLDTLVGIFGIGQNPKGDKDPFALRRQALAVNRILIENQLPISLEAALQMTKHGYGNLVDEEVIPKLIQFCFERLKAWELEQGYAPQVIDAVMANHPTAPYDAHQRILAVAAFQSLPEAEHLAQANKRVRNILQKSGGITHITQAPPIDSKLLQDVAEKKLYEKLQLLETETEPLIFQGQYQEALTKLAQLQKPVDDFFDEVMVMVDDPDLKENRIHLLSHLSRLFMQIADISRLVI